MQEPEYLEMDNFENEEELEELELGEDVMESQHTEESIPDEMETLEEHSELELDDSEVNCDDPIRMYLQQMGEIPLLSRR